MPRHRYRDRELDRRGLPLAWAYLATGLALPFLAALAVADRGPAVILTWFAAGVVMGLVFGIGARSYYAPGLELRPRRVALRALAVFASMFAVIGVLRAVEAMTSGDQGALRLVVQVPAVCAAGFLFHVAWRASRVARVAPSDLGRRGPDLVRAFRLRGRPPLLLRNLFGSHRSFLQFDYDADRNRYALCSIAPDSPWVWVELPTNESLPAGDGLAGAQVSALEAAGWRRDAESRRARYIRAFSTARGDVDELLIDAVDHVMRDVYQAEPDEILVTELADS